MLKFLPCGMFLLATLACQSGSFQGQSKSNSVPPAGAEVGAGSDANGSGQPGSESFALELRESLLDVVWVIDNSGSMSEEAAQVRANFDRFIESVSDQANLQVALISAEAPVGRQGTSVKLSEAAKAKGHRQLNTPIGSTNGLAVIASASCATDETELNLSPTNITDLDFMEAGSKICGIDQFSYTPGFLDEYRNEGNYIEGSSSLLAADLRGSLTSFYREGATQIFVFVTDDNAQAIDGVNFLSGIKASSPNLQPIVYSFSGLANSSCDIARVGSAYSLLAEATKGQTFDICAADWSEQFKALQSSVVQKANSKFVLAGIPAEGSVAVIVDGTPLAADQFTVSGNEVVVDELVLQASGSDKIEITYINQ